MEQRRNWQSPQAGDTFRIADVASGTTPRVSVQITNSTPGLILVGQVDNPELLTEDDDNVKKIPPRSTGNYPWNYPVLSARYIGTVGATGNEYVDFIFTDSPVNPGIIPGVAGVVPIDVPINVVTAGDLPVVISDPSGLNIAGLFVQNQTCQNVVAVLPSGETVVAPPYSWFTIPLNVEFVGLSVSPGGGFFDFDTLYIAYANINYTEPFVAAAGSLPNPFSDIYANVFNRTVVSQGVVGTGTTQNAATLVTLTPGQWFLVYEINGDVSGAWSTAGFNSAQMFVEATQGIDGLGGGTAGLVTATVVGPNLAGLATAVTPCRLTKPLLIRNLDDDTNNLISCRLSTMNASLAFAQVTLYGALVNA